MSNEEMSSDATQNVLKSGTLVPELETMKVPEIKKRLKSLGLSTVGNKAELVERLQEAYLGEKEGSLDGGLDDESLEEALLNDDPDQNTTAETSLLGGEEFSFSSPEKDVQKIQSASTKPLKKRAVAQIAESTVESSKTPTKIVLKRDNYPIIEAPKTTECKKDRPLIEPPKSDVLAKTAEVKKTASLPETDRLQMRAKRFNITDSKPKVAAVAPIQVSGTLNPSSLEVLRKRAERFGENVSTVMKKLENQEKLLKRKMKFHDSDSTTKTVGLDSQSLSTEQEKKKKRMERFGLIK